MFNTINCKGKLLDLRRPKIMGILNITPDSFFDGGRYTEKEQILNRCRQIVNQGADIIDVGAYSSRPGAEEVSEKEEVSRLTTALEIIRTEYPEACISVDTFRSSVVRFAYENFAIDIINDISGGQFSADMFQTVADLNLPYIMMHIQGTPATMQQNPTYDDVVADIIKYFSERIKKATLTGINDIIIDPGFGFGKTIDHNYQLMAQLDKFKVLERPVLVGVSRKSMIYRFLGITPEQALPGTIALNTVAVLKGASVLRVHDVAEAKQALDVVQKMQQFDYEGSDYS